MVLLLNCWSCLQGSAEAEAASVWSQLVQVSVLKDFERRLTGPGRLARCEWRNKMLGLCGYGLCCHAVVQPYHHHCVMVW